MSLGRRLVREIEADENNDTLHRWLAHHLAELLLEAEADPAVADRAVDTILRIWSHRRDLPGRSYPLADYKDALSVLERLASATKPWNNIRPNERGWALAQVYDGMNRLFLSALMLEFPEFCVDSESRTAEAFLDEDERRVVQIIEEVTEWLHRPVAPTVSLSFQRSDDATLDESDDVEDSDDPDSSVLRLARAMEAQIDSVQAQLISLKAIVREKLLAENSSEEGDGDAEA